MIVAERWQQWMPFHIDRFRGSPSVQAMHPSARIGYLYLLASMWQTDTCTLPHDNEVLADLSGLGSMWEEFGAKILRKFVITNNVLTNSVLNSEWIEAKRVFEARRQAAQNTNKSRSPNGHRKVSGRRPSRRADTQTLTGTLTNTDKATTPANAGFELPNWIDSEIWDTYLEVRASKKAAKTPRAWRAVLKQLDAFRLKGHDPTAILETSIRSNWIDVYEPKTGGTNGRYESPAAALHRKFSEELDKETAANPV